MQTRQRQFVIIGGVVVVAVLALVAFIALSGNVGGSGIDYASLPYSYAEDGAFVLGNPDAPVTIIEFADYACPACQEYKPTINRFIEEFVVTGLAKFEFRHFPTAGGAMTDYLGRVAACADEQRNGAFWQAYDLLFNLAATGRYNEDAVGILQRELGLESQTELALCAEDNDRVTEDANLGRSGGVSGTPAIMVRYNDGPADFINFNGTTYSQGGVPFDVLAGVVQSAQPAAE